MVKDPGVAVDATGIMMGGWNGLLKFVIARGLLAGGL